jgi:RNA polymerase sigma-70 factor, ECF subfamily
MTDDTDDAALLAALSRGDHRALDTLYDRHAPILFALAIHVVGDRTRAEDLLHDVFLDLARHAKVPGASCPHVVRWLVLRLFERTR